ncbi:hypothetical protein NP233_g12444 [Leucocoprinus birnbaumii]|uniref:Ketoreductase domain-containing protein n=1 Tax=Leucocoprinus birnbaumii TaxID=56174 RepID=A0AAD5VEM9_9AGAR|nr:hypothetical protein NP233_g12444 [Leucocoprinus birnbaumii]
MPSESGFFQAQDSDAYAKLYHALDFLAVKQFRETLQREPRCGDAIHRLRYLKRMEDLIQDQNSIKVVNDQDLLEQKRKFPAFFEVTRRLGEVHESLLQSSQAAVNVLFADDLMSRYYAEHNGFTKGCEEMAEQLDRILHFMRDSGRHVVRLLEVGAAYDATKDPFSQGLSPESYDIIIAYHVLHVAPEIQTLSQQLHDMLVPGGFLLVTELDGTSWFDKPGTAWMDFAFGSFAEWFNYRDDRAHCSMSPSQWRSVLGSAGFDNFSTIVGSGHCLDFIYTCQRVTPGKPFDQPPIITLIRFEAGKELELQKRLKTFNPISEGVLCVWTDSKYDGDTALGLVMTLVNEFPSWTIWLAMFSSCMDPTTVEGTVKQNHQHLSRERFVYFSCDGSPSFPRIVRLPSLPVAPADSPSLVTSPDHLLVRLVDRDTEGGFIGEVLQSDDPSIPVHSCVAGLISSFATQNTVAIHSGSVIRIPQLDKRIPALLAAVFLHYHVVGASFSTYSAHHHPSLRVLVSMRNKDLEKTLESLLKRATGVSVLEDAPDDFVDALVTDYYTLDANPVLEESVGTNGRVVIWSPQLLAETLSREPWVLRHVLETGLQNLDLKPTNGHLHPSTLAGTSLAMQQKNAEEPLIDPGKAYVLIGGIGGIGLHLAVWLYKNGARHIYLTSRRGRESATEAHDVFLSLKLQYLERQSDLDLKLYACNALDKTDVAAFLETVEQPIGGCFLMPLVLRDALFLQQSHESIETVRQSKLGALDVLASVCNIKSMDFFVAFSSVGALWGNVGQSNYASSCSALGGRVSEFPNAFAILVPAILDAGYLMQAGVLEHLNVAGSFEWGIGVEDLCGFIKDGISRVKAGVNPSILVPTLDLEVVNQYIPLPPFYRFVLPRSSPKQLNATAEMGQVDSSRDEILATLGSARAVVLTGLGVEDQNAFLPDLPFVNLGLDSIRATRLSRELKPYVQVTQTDLLVGMTWNDLEDKIRKSRISNSTRTPDAALKSKEFVLIALGIDPPSNFSPDVPFVNCGLDSIRATQLSRQLRPYVRVTHMDLLLGMCWRDLEEKILQSTSPSNQESSASSLHLNGALSADGARELVVHTLGIEPASFDPDIPFVNYGLDSIRATQLARKLKPFIAVTQMDLLLGMTWKGLEEKIRGTISKTPSSPPTPVKENPGTCPSYLLFPGITGNLSSISPLLTHFPEGSATLWASHFDFSACEDNPPTMDQLAKQVLSGISERHPSGPLRLISVSGSSTLACVLTKALEHRGRDVTDVSFLDHFPALFCHDAYGLRPFMESEEDNADILKAKDDVAEKGVEIMLRMQEVDSIGPASPSTQDDATRLQGINYLKTARVTNNLIIQTIKDVYYQRRSHPFEAYDDTLVGWLASIKAPFLLAVADRGFNLVVEMPWADMGAGRMLPYKTNVEVLHLDEGHFSIVGCEQLARRLFH